MAQLKDLIVTGASRFLNNIYGNLIGNATSADKVNHSLAIEIGTETATFDGSADVPVKVDASTFGLAASTRLVGVLNTAAEQFNEQEINGLLYATSTCKIGTTLAIPLAVNGLYGSGITTTSGSTITNSGNAQVTGQSCFYPLVGDILLEGSHEWLCIQKTTSATLWVKLGGVDTWGTW